MKKGGKGGGKNYRGQVSNKGGISPLSPSVKTLPSVFIFQRVLQTCVCIMQH